MSYTPRDSRGRLQFFRIFGIVLFGILAVRLTWLQAVEGRRSQDQILTQHERRERVLPARGKLLDRNGEQLAYSVENPVLFADLQLLSDPGQQRQVARVLAPLLDMTADQIERQMARRHSGLVPINIKPTAITDAELDRELRKLKELKLPGIVRGTVPKRVYPLGAAAATVTGFVGIDQEGIEGTERAFDSELQGTPGWQTYLCDARGGKHLADTEKQPVPGNTVILTIDAYLQQVVADRLHEAVKRCNAKSGWALVVQPRTGEVLAMANEPTYDPTYYETAAPASYRNHIISDRIEPGSTIKAVTVSAALEDGVMRPETPINCMGGRWMLFGKPVTDHEGFGTLTFMDTFVHSSNIAMAQVGLKVGATRMHHYLKQFGFGQKCGIGLPGEETGYLKRLENWSGRTPATVAFGYEVQVTALQLAMAYAALANDGILLKPHIVKQVISPEGQVLRQTEPEQVHRVVSSETAHRLLQFMGRVVTDGTGRKAASDWCVVGGKTGTARKLDPVTHQYVSKYYASFIGLAPLENPTFLCYVVIDEPRGEIYGGSTAAPAFKEILEAAWKSPHPIIRPDYPVVVAGAAAAPAAPARGRVTSLRFASIEEAAAESAAAVAMLRAMADSAAADSGTAGPPAPMRRAPDLIGLTMREASQRLEGTGLGAIAAGDGVIVRQFPAPGAPMTPMHPGELILFFGTAQELTAREDREVR